VVSACCSSCQCKCDLWPDTFHFISIQCNAAYRNRHAVPTLATYHVVLFFAVGKIPLAYRHRRLRSRQHATGNITTHTSPAASYALVRLRPPSYGRSPPESWPFMPALGILWLSTTNLFFNNLMSFCSYSPPFVWGLHGHLCDQFLFVMLTHVPCGDMWYLRTIHALNRIGARICVSLL